MDARSQARLGKWLVSGPPLVYLIFFFAVPALIMVLASFRTPGEFGGLAPLVENGNSVAVEVTVESPMTLDAHVKAIHVFNEKNPQPNVASVHLGPRAGRASLATRARLADSQRIVAVAELSDGTFWTDEVDVIARYVARNLRR